MSPVASFRRGEGGWEGYHVIHGRSRMAIDGGGDECLVGAGQVLPLEGRVS